MDRHAAIVCLVSLTALFAMSLAVSPSARAAPAMKWPFHAGDAFLRSLNPSFSPVVAKNSTNGDTVAVMGGGTYNPGGRVSGAGLFWHNRSDGSSLDFGTWTADAVLNYDDFWNRVVNGFPRTFHGGVLVLAVTATDNFGITVSGVLTVTCVLGDSVQADRGLLLQHRNPALLPRREPICKDLRRGEAGCGRPRAAEPLYPNPPCIQLQGEGRWSLISR